MDGQFAREEMLFGKDAVEKLHGSRVAVFGVGGVGGYAAEALARGGVGSLELIDSDTVSVSNINRQIVALHSTVGRYKVDVAAERARDIWPEIDVTARRCFFLHENENEFDFGSYDYVVDAVDTVAAKLALARACALADTKIISAMGAGNKLDPTAFRVADIFETKVCPLAKVMRSELRKMGVEKLKVVYSEEPPVSVGGRTPGSNSFVPPVMGFIIAGEVIKDIVNSPPSEGCRRSRRGGL